MFRGDLYLVGGGDPTFGSASFTRRSYGSGATVQALAAELEDAGIRRVTGRVYGDESRFDSLRGGPESGYRISPYVGPLSALAYNRGLASENGRGYQSSPAGFAASALTGALRARGVRVSRRAPRQDRRRPAQRSWPRSSRPPWPAWRPSPTSRPTTSSPRCC